ncbi:MAG: hypothetical protein FWC50_04755 [Planctomycetaceae bacterium]|nr:hypothetical protein [Planctomycetaceae bacterium]
MRDWILGIIVACLMLMLVGNIVLAQAQDFDINIPVQDFAKGFEKVVIDGQEIFVPPEMKRLIDEGKLIVITSGGGPPSIMTPETKRLIDEGKITFPTEEERQLVEEQQRQQEEQQRQQEELQRRIFDEIGITEAETEQLGVNMAGIEESYMPIAEKYENVFGNLSSDNYVEAAEIFSDKLLRPAISDLRAEAASFLGEDRYAQLAIRLYQVMDMGGELPFLGGRGPDGSNEIFKMLLLPDVIDLTKDQLDALVQIQKEFVTEQIGIEIMQDQEEKSLETQLSEAKTDEERADIEERLKKVREESKKAAEASSQKLLAKMKAKLDTLLTAEQKAKLAQLKENIPDYMKQALGDMKKTDDVGKASAAWRPGANSWVPGMGVPKNLEGTREAPRAREPRGERQFPGEK